MSMIIGLQMIGLVGIVGAEDYNANSIQLIPKGDISVISGAYKTLTTKESQYKFWDNYNNLAKSSDFDPGTAKGLANQLTSGIMTWDTIIAYSSVVIEFISNLGLVVGAGFIIYSGYQYAMSGLGGEEGKPKAIKNAFIGIAVIAMSYGIFRLLARIFIE